MLVFVIAVVLLRGMFPYNLLIGLLAGVLVGVLTAPRGVPELPSPRTARAREDGQADSA